MLTVRFVGMAIATVVALHGVASADRADATCIALDAAFPRLPEVQKASMGQRLQDELSEVGNQLGHHMNVLSNDVLSFQFDVRARRAKVRVGAGDDRYARFAVATDVTFTQQLARVEATVDFAIEGHRYKLELPAFELMPQSYQGDRVVVLLVPVVERRW